MATSSSELLTKVVESTATPSISTMAPGWNPIPRTATAVPAGEAGGAGGVGLGRGDGPRELDGPRGGCFGAEPFQRSAGEGGGAGPGRREEEARGQAGGQGPPACRDPLRSPPNVPVHHGEPL